MENTGYIYKQDNTQKVFLSEKTIDVEDILKNTMIIFIKQFVRKE